MKSLLAYLSICLAFVFTEKVTACVDYHPQPLTSVIFADSEFNNAELRVQNLQIFAGAPGDYCTCAFSNMNSYSQFITFMAFVEPNTMNPIPGFAVWEANSVAGTAWATHGNGVEWEGFVASVVQNMTPGEPVEFVARFDLTNAPVDGFFEVIGTSSLGTDEWDNDNSDLALSHYSESFLFQDDSVKPTIVSDDYFSVNVEETQNPSGIYIYPNPNNGEFTLNHTNSREVLIHIHDQAGREVYSEMINGYSKNFFLPELTSGVYILMYEIGEGMVSRQRMIVY